MFSVLVSSVYTGSIQMSESGIGRGGPLLFLGDNFGKWSHENLDKTYFEIYPTLPKGSNCEVIRNSLYSEDRSRTVP